MNFLSSLQTYGEQYEVVGKTRFSEQDLAQVGDAFVVINEIGKSVRINLKNSTGYKFIKLSRNSENLVAGELVDLKTAEIIELKRAGDAHSIFVIECEAAK